MTVTISDTNGIPDLLRRVSELSQYEVQIGVFQADTDPYPDGTDVISIAFAHEFGSYRVPERSFMRAGFDTNKSRIDQLCETLADRVLHGGLDARAMYEAIGAEVTGLIQEHLTNLRDPPNSPETIARKGSSNPLIDTGQLRSSITWKVVRS